MGWTSSNTQEEVQASGVPDDIRTRTRDKAVFRFHNSLETIGRWEVKLAGDSLEETGELSL